MCIRDRYALITLIVLVTLFGMYTISRGSSSNVDSSSQSTPAAREEARRQANGGELTYTQIRDVLSEPKQIAKAELDPNSGRVHVQFRSNAQSDVRGVVPPESVSRLADKLAKGGVEVDVQAGPGAGAPWGVKLLTQLLIFGLLAAAVIWMMRRSGTGTNKHLSGDIRDSAKVKNALKVMFADVAGCDKAVEEISEFRDFLLKPQRFKALGAKMPAGAILYGPPGTGKTLLAKALAHEAHVSYFAVSGSDFVESIVGRGAARVRDLFAKARDAAPAVIFIDEIDAVGKKRDGGVGGTDERDQTLNQLLVEMDGFDTDSRVVVLAATNRLDTLDPALLRAGRLSRQIRVDVPDESGRRAILDVHSAGKPLADDVDLDVMAKVTAGSSGADLADMLNEAAIMAAREGVKQITHRHLSEGHLRALAGPEKRSSSMSDEERELVAFHEAGHVLTAELCAEHEKAQRATIRPRGQAAGLALYGRNDRTIHSAQYLHEKLICALGGRAAEWVKYGKVSSGAANDLQQVNALARQAVEQLGFSPRAGQLIVSASGGQQMPVSDATREIIDAEVERMVAQAYAEAIRLLETHREALNSLAAALLDGEDLAREEIVAAVAAGGVIPTSAARPVKQLAPRTVPVLHLPDETPKPARRRRRRRAKAPAVVPQPAVAAVDRADPQQAVSG